MKRTLLCDCCVPAAAQPPSALPSPFPTPPQANEVVQGSMWPVQWEELQVSSRTIQNAVNVITGKKLRDLREES